MPISRRRLASFIVPAVGLPLLAAGCTSPEPVLYTIPMKPGPVLAAGPAVIQLRDIGLASYLDRREIVRSSEGYKLGVSSNNWWGEPLGAMLGRVIVIGLSERLPGSSIYAEGGAISADPNAIIAVNISGSISTRAASCSCWRRPRSIQPAQALGGTHLPYHQDRAVGRHGGPGRGDQRRRG